MSIVLYSQRDPKYASHVLGWGPLLGTIGQYGCYDTVCAMIAASAGVASDPVSFDMLATSRGEFLRDPTGTYDFLPDNALDIAFPGRFHTTYFPGFRADLIAAAIPRPNQYAYGHIVTASVPTHFVWFMDTLREADPWYGSIGPLSGYGGPTAIQKTYIVDFIPLPPPPAIAEPSPVVVPSPTPVPLPTPPPVTLPPFVPVKYSVVSGVGFRIEDIVSLPDAMAVCDAIARFDHVETNVNDQSSGDSVYTAKAA